MLNIEISYGTAHKQKLYCLQVVKGTLARQALLMVDISADFPEISLEDAPLGVFGKRVKDNYLLQEGDRLEIYRPLLADPKEARRKRIMQKR